MRPVHWSMPVALATAIVITTGCRGNRAADAIPPEPAPDSGLTAAVDSARARAEREEAGREAAGRAADRDRAARAERARIDAVMSSPVHFSFDRSDLSVQTRADLDDKLEVLRANPTLRIRVEGHADDRGASEYNLSLGMRRAAAVRRYFLQREIADDRIDTASFGEERPLCRDPEESCWGINRRAEFVILAR